MLEWIPQKGWFIFCKNNCIYCDLSENILKESDTDYRKMYMEDFSAVEIQNAKEVYNFHTYPVIFCDGKYIGGYDALKRVSNANPLFTKK